MEGKNEKITENTTFKNYKRVDSADRPKVNELVVKAKGPRRSMRQFAIACGVSPSTFTRLCHSEEGPVSSEMLFRIAKEADPDSGVTFDILMQANGMRKASDGIAFEEKARNILISEILNRGFSVRIEENVDSEGKKYSRWHWPDIRIVTDAIPVLHYLKEDDLTRGIEGIVNWIFEICRISEKYTYRESAWRIYQQMLTVWGCLYCQELGADKISFVVDNQEVFSELIAIVDDLELRDWTSIILIDAEEGKVCDEYNIPIEGIQDIPKIFLKERIKINMVKSRSTEDDDLDDILWD